MKTSFNKSDVTELIEITKSGTAAKSINNFTDIVKEVMNSTAELYTAAGYYPPWIGYLALEEKQCVGTCHCVDTHHLNLLQKITGWKLHISLFLNARDRV